MYRAIRNMDKPLLIATIAMLIFGLLMIFSSSNAMATVEWGNPYRFLFREGIFLIIGIIIFLFFISTPTKNYYKLSLLAIGIIIILLLGLDVFGAATRSAKSWIPIGPFGLQPSEFSKMALIVYMGAYYERVIARNRNDIITAVKPLFAGAMCFLLTALQPDFGTAIIIFGIVVAVFFYTPIDKQIKKAVVMIGTIIGFLVGLVILFTLVSGYDLFGDKMGRFNIIEPCTRYQDATGYQVCNGYIAINNGGLTGVGLGNSTQKYLYLPEAHTDFIFPVIVEEWGLIGGSVVLLLLFFIVCRIMIIARRSASLRGSIISYGVAVYLMLHIFINLTGVLGLAPLTGVPLPFLSYGGSSLWTLIIGLALVQRTEIERNENLKKNIIQKSIM